MKHIFLIALFFTIWGITYNVIRFWPDGKLHIYYCDVGQGDGMYLKFPTGADMVIDGGPDNGKLLECLSHHMPLWDRQIDLVMMTHPQLDHAGGFPDLFNRYNVKLVVAPPVGNDSDNFREALKIIQEKKIPLKNLYSGDVIRFGEAKLAIIWPEKSWMMAQIDADCQLVEGCILGDSKGKKTAILKTTTGAVLGAQTSTDLNHASMITHLSYGNFDALFTADTTQETDIMIANAGITVASNASDPIEVLKVPHHGSKTGMAEALLHQINPRDAVISVGKKNRYGHPNPQVVSHLEEHGIRIHRTDQEGTIEVVSDGKSWSIENGK